MLRLGIEWWNGFLGTSEPEGGNDFFGG